MARTVSRAAIEHVGWLDVRAVIDYAHDVPEYPRELAVEADDLRVARARI